MPVVTIRRFFAVAGLFAAAWLGGCDAVNAPYRAADASGSVLYTAFEIRPKYLDPASSFNLNETAWMNNIYEPPFHYHYLKRPYTVEGLTTDDGPTPAYFDKDGKPLADSAPPEQVASSIYTIHLKPGIRFQPHPAFAQDAPGHYLYQNLSPAQIAGKASPWDFPLDHAAVTSRELTADDYVYEIKRLASPYVPTPVPLYGQFSNFIVGMKDLRARLDAIHAKEIATRPARDPFLPWHDLRQDTLEGARALDKYTLEIRVIGKYPQFKYWLTHTAFSPVPWEVDRFYAQRGMADNSLSLNTWPCGTGPYMLKEARPTRYVLVRNPNYRGERYPSEGMPEDKERGWLADAGKQMPFIDKVVYTLEKEHEPQVAKFMQGYYDIPQIDRVDLGFDLLKEQLDKTGRYQLIADHQVQLVRALEPANWYVGFNYLDPVVGKGDTPEQQIRNRKLRQALSIAIDWEEWNAIFFDIYGMSEVGMGPVPPGLFGYRTGKAGINPVTHIWQDGHAVRRPLEDAKRLLAEAGYPDGRDAQTGKPLVLFYDANGVGATYQARLDWQVKQLQKLGVQLEVRATDYNRFQDRMLKGSDQIYFWGWVADYPDPEDFLSLLTTRQGKVKYEGENAANYSNAEYDRLYEQMRMLPDGPARQQVIDKMVDIVRNDAVWSFGQFPGSQGVTQPWLHNVKPSSVLLDKIKYMRVDGKLRAEKIAEWNRPRLWPLSLMALALLAIIWPAWHFYRRRELTNARGQVVTASQAASLTDTRSSKASRS